MTNEERQKQVEGAWAYETLHVPALFRNWCPIVLDSAGVKTGDRVLDVACGTGILAREALDRVKPTGSVDGVDPGYGMLAVANELAPDISWKEGTAEDLPYADQTFDTVVSQFGLMFFMDRKKALSEMLRVLKPGGKLVVAVWDSLENTEAYRDEVELFEKLAGKDAAEALKAPFVMGDRNDLLALFKEAGVQSVNVTTQSQQACFPDIRSMVEADLRGWLPVMGVLLEEETIQHVLNEAEQVLKGYVSENGKVLFNAPAHIISGNASAT